MGGDTYIGSSWVCLDCCYYISFGELPSHMTDEEAHAWSESWDKANAGYRHTLGLASEEHDENCPRFHGDTDVECDCEVITFSSSQCDCCGSHLGGERHAVSVWKEVPDTCGCCGGVAAEQPANGHGACCAQPHAQAYAVAHTPETHSTLEELASVLPAAMLAALQEAVSG